VDSYVVGPMCLLLAGSIMPSWDIFSFVISEYGCFGYGGIILDLQIISVSFLYSGILSWYLLGRCHCHMFFALYYVILARFTEKAREKFCFPFNGMVDNWTVTRCWHVYCVHIWKRRWNVHP